MLTTSSNALEIVAALEAEARKFSQHVETALDRRAEVIKQDEEREIQVSYTRRIPNKGEYRRPKSGRHRATTNLSAPAWERSGALINGVQIESSPRERRISVGGEAGQPIPGYPGGYAQRLKELPDGPDGVNRSNDFAGRTVQKGEAQYVALFEQDLESLIGS